MCHGDNLAGDTLVDDFAFARIAASNLTSGRGGIGGTYSDIDYVRAIRHGVGNDGKGLPIMPSEAFNKFSDHDLGAMIAYLKTLPPVDNEVIIEGSPDSANLTSGGELGSWSESDFINTLRTGVTPKRKLLNPNFMPWNRFSFMTDEEIKAIWLHVRALPLLAP